MPSITPYKHVHTVFILSVNVNIMKYKKPISTITFVAR